MRKKFECLDVVGLFDCTDYSVIEETSGLTAASMYGHLRCVKTLVEEYGVNLNEICKQSEIAINRFPNGKRPLTVAIIKNHVDIVRYLISMGAVVCRIKD